MLSWEDFPGCCNGIVIYNFGGTKNSMWGNGKVHEDLNNFFDWAIKTFGHFMLVATTNNEQTEANKLLAEKGFNNIGWMHKNQHPDTVFTMWYRVPDYNDNLIKRFWKGEKPLV